MVIDFSAGINAQNRDPGHPRVALATNPRAMKGERKGSNAALIVKRNT
jgi:hypothetical protein